MSTRGTLLGRILLGASAGLLLLWAGACALLYAYQRDILYQAVPTTVARADDTLFLNLHADGQVPGVRLRVTVHGAPGPRAVLYFGGNAEDVARALPLLRAAYPERALYLLHYRGYAGSAGSPSEDALRADALALYDFVSPRHAQVLVVGRSLGTGVAVALAARRPVQRLVLVTPFDSIEKVAGERFPWFPASLLMHDTWRSSELAPHIHVPTLVLVAGRDAVISRARSDALVRAFPPDAVRVRVLAGSGHNDVQARADYVPLLRSVVPSFTAAGRDRRAI